jgi:hypothetical protein
MTGCALYVKRPLPVEAIQWTGTNIEALHAAYGPTDLSAPDPALGHQHLEVRTLEGTMRARVGDWIIRGVYGELYPCREHIFADTYMPAPAPPTTHPGGTRP